MADFAARLRTLERKLEWMMGTMRMRAVVTSGVLGANGEPVPTQTFEGTMEELYRLSKEFPTATQDEAEPPPIDDGNVKRAN